MPRTYSTRALLALALTTAAGTYAGRLLPTPEAAAPAWVADRLFLAGMIKHHGGALSMVRELFATPGAGQDGDIFAFASDVEADQQMEIDRMGALLRELQK